MNNILWQKRIKALSKKCRFAKPATDRQLNAAETKLGVKLPEDLRSLLSESNGVEGEFGEGVIWPLKQIVEDNLSFRENPEFGDLYMPFNNLLFFADTGSGSQFAFPIQADGAIHRADVFVWNHEDDSRSWIASSLMDYLERLLKGEIEL